MAIVLRVIEALALPFSFGAQALQSTQASALGRHAAHGSSNLFVGQTLPPQPN
ncbi:MAG TPA: hypothetical protein VHU83_17110 [Bryobacteraceae bacterium]|nr:hypothetical protein [Bryobacteraceae bacterium]